MAATGRLVVTMTDAARDGGGLFRRLRRTSAARIVALYLAVFVASTAIVLGSVTWAALALIDRQIDQTLDAEVRGLAEQYRLEGLGRLIEVVRARSGLRSPGIRSPTGPGDRGPGPGSGDSGIGLGGIYLLAAPDGVPIEGTLSGWPRAAERAADGTLDAKLADGRRARIRVYRLAGGFRLLVGRDLAERARFRELVVEASFWSLGLVLVLGLYGGWILARRSLARVDAMALAARRIVGGDLDERLPRAGSGDEYDRLAQAVNAMLDEIGRLMTASRVASDAMAHDLRGPLARARVTVEAVALRQPEPSEARAGLEEALAEIDRVIATFEALTAIGRAESGAGRTAWSDVDLSALVTELGEIYDLLFEEAGRVLEARIAPGITRPGDRALMQRAVANLLENTLKHGAGPVVLSLARDAHDDAIVIRVADRGPGVPAGERARVVERFARLDPARSLPGSGLGLALVDAVTRLHGGRLVLTDADAGAAGTADGAGPGLAVELRLPAGGGAPRPAGNGLMAGDGQPAGGVAPAAGDVGADSGMRPGPSA